MSQPASKKMKNAPWVSQGIFTKREMAELVDGGTFHIHSGAQPEVAQMAKITEEARLTGVIPGYPWEPKAATTLYRVPDSPSRASVTQRIIEEHKLSRYIRERAQLVLEELLSNAIFHSYRGANGQDKYRRKDLVQLADKEVVEVQVYSAAEGLYLLVRDRGGSLKPEDLQKVFARCYGPAEQQIESKEGGAGLGLYMVFEQVTHMKITTEPGVGTEVAVWIASRATFDPNAFSFNFFQRR